MGRVTLFLLFFFIPLFAKTVDVSSLERQENYYLLLEPNNKSASIQEILESKNWESVNSNNVGFKKDGVFSKVYLTNSSKSVLSVFLRNPRPGTDKIDVYIFKDKKLVQTYKLGDTRAKDTKQFSDRYNSFQLLVEPNSHYIVLSKLQNIGTISIGWQFSYIDEYLNRSIKEITLTIIIAGIIFSLIIYNFILFINLRYTFFLIYSLIGTFSLMSQLIMNNVFSIFIDNVVILEFVNNLLIVFNGLTMLMMLLFAMYFFDTKNSMKKLHKLSSLVVVIALVLITFIHFNKYTAREEFAILGPFLIIVFVFAIGVNALINKRIGASYFLWGQSIFFFAFYILTVGFIPGVTSFSKEFLFAVAPIGTLIDLILIGIAQAKLLEQIKIERYKLSSVANSRLNSIGKGIAGVLHQWKSPLVRIGANSAELESTLMFKDGEDLKFSIEEINNKLKSNIQNMEEVLEEFGKFYKYKSGTSYFTIEDVYKDAVTLLQERIDLESIKMRFFSEIDETIYSNKTALSQVFLTLLNNAIDVLSERDKKRREVFVDVVKRKEAILITVEDTGGGIETQPIDLIFECFVSEKHSSENFGAGLMICKMLVEDKLKGAISVENSKMGARFTIVIPT